MCAEAIDKCELGRIFETHGQWMHEHEDYEQALAYHVDAINMCRSCENNHKCMLKKLNNLAMTFVYKGEIEQAIDTYQQSIDLLKTVQARLGGFETCPID